jgi:hypothetical protein
MLAVYSIIHDEGKGVNSIHSVLCSVVCRGGFEKCIFRFSQAAFTFNIQSNCFLALQAPRVLWQDVRSTPSWQPAPGQQNRQWLTGNRLR